MLTLQLYSALFFSAIACRAPSMLADAGASRHSRRHMMQKKGFQSPLRFLSGDLSSGPTKKISAPASWNGPAPDCLLQRSWEARTRYIHTYAVYIKSYHGINHHHSLSYCEATVGSNGTLFSLLLRKGVCLSQTRGCGALVLLAPPTFCGRPFP